MIIIIKLDYLKVLSYNSGFGSNHILIIRSIKLLLNFLKKIKFNYIQNYW